MYEITQRRLAQASNDRHCSRRVARTLSIGLLTGALALGYVVGHPTVTQKASLGATGANTAQVAPHGPCGGVPDGCN